MIEIKENRIYGMYESGAEFTDDLEAMARECLKMGAAQTKWGQCDPGDWMGLSAVPNKGGERAYSMTKRLMCEGYDVGTKLIDKIGESITAPMPMSIRRRNRWQDNGDDLNMQSVWNGDLQRAWRKPVSVSARGPQRIRILVDAISYGDLSAEIVAIRGAAAVKLADLLTSAGFGVQVSSGWSANSGEYNLNVITKQFSQPIDISTLAATTVLPAFFRCLGHMWGPLAKSGRNGYGGYGVDSISDETASELMGEDANGMTFIAHQQLKTHGQANEWVADCIQKIEAARNPELALAA